MKALYKNIILLALWLAVGQLQAQCWLSELGRRTNSSDEVGQELADALRRDPKLIDSYKLAFQMFSSNSKYLSDVPTLKQIGKMSDPASNFRNKFPDSWQDELTDLIANNSELRCKACGNTETSNSLLARLPTMDEMLKNVEYFTKYKDVNGFDNAFAAFKSGANNRDGVNHMAKYMRNNPAEFNNITAFEFNYADDILRRADIAVGSKLYEFKSWTKGTDQPWNGFFGGSGNSYNQFLDYLRNTDNLDELRYVFNKAKVSELDLRNAFKGLFMSKNDEIFNVIKENKSLWMDLFDNIDDVLAKRLFDEMINTKDERLFRFIILK